MSDVRDLTDRRSIAVLKAYGWIEVWAVEGGFRVELHRPEKAPGGGMIDRPKSVETGDWREGVRVLLDDSQEDLDELIGRLEPKGER